MDVQKLFGHVITVEAGKRHKPGNFPVLSCSEEWLSISHFKSYYKNIIRIKFAIHAYQGWNSKTIVGGFCLKFHEKNGLSLPHVMLVQKWVFNSSREWRFCWRNNSRLMVDTVWYFSGLHSAQQEHQHSSVCSLIAVC